MLNHTSYRAVPCDVIESNFREKCLLAVISLVKILVGCKITRALTIILAILSGLTENFWNPMLIINSKKTKDHDLTNIYFIKLFQELMKKFLITNHRKCSNDFAAACKRKFGDGYNILI